MRVGAPAGSSPRSPGGTRTQLVDALAAATVTAGDDNTASRLAHSPRSRSLRSPRMRSPHRVATDSLIRNVWADAQHGEAIDSVPVVAAGDGAQPLPDEHIQQQRQQQQQERQPQQQPEQQQDSSDSGRPLATLQAAKETLRSVFVGPADFISSTGHNVGMAAVARPPPQAPARLYGLSPQQPTAQQQIVVNTFKASWQAASVLHRCHSAVHAMQRRLAHAAARRAADDGIHEPSAAIVLLHRKRSGGGSV